VLPGRRGGAADVIAISVNVVYAIFDALATILLD
jgi:hypothetical protein